MANKFTQGGGGGGGGSDGGGTDGASGGDGGIAWSDIAGAPTIPSWITDPASKIRGVIYGDLLRGFAKILAPIFIALTTLSVGTNPDVFAGPNEQYGIADLLTLLLRMVGNLMGMAVAGFFGILDAVFQAITVELPGPLGGVVATVATVAIILVMLEVGRRLFWAIIDLIPSLSGLIGGG